jgi:hypothetical protein
MGERPDGGDGFEGAVSPVAAAAGKAETAVLIGFRFRNWSRSRAVGGVNQDDSGLPPTTRSPLNPLRYPPQLLKSPKSSNIWNLRGIEPSGIIRQCPKVLKRVRFRHDEFSGQANGFWAHSAPVGKVASRGLTIVTEDADLY